LIWIGLGGYISSRIQRFLVMFYVIYISDSKAKYLALDIQGQLDLIGIYCLILASKTCKMVQ
jgi:hypothetical protein